MPPAQHKQDRRALHTGSAGVGPQLHCQGNGTETSVHDPRFSHGDALLRTPAWTYQTQHAYRMVIRRDRIHPGDEGYGAVRGKLQQEGGRFRIHPEAARRSGARYMAAERKRQRENSPSILLSGSSWSWKTLYSTSRTGCGLSTP